MNATQGTDLIERCGIVAVFRGNFPPEIALPVAETLVTEGINALEFTTNSPQAFEAMQAAKRAFGEGALIGMGTVLDVENAQRALDAGAEMIVSPAFHEGVVTLAHQHDALAIPGVITATEAVSAWATGARLLKLFPIGPLGVDYLKAMRGPLDHMRFMCNGGTDDSNVGAFIRAGAVACGLGAWLTGVGDMPLETVRERVRILNRLVREGRATA